MSEDEARRAVISLWMSKADLALTAADRELVAGDLSLAVNRVYYAGFYALSAVLLRDDQEFSSHAGVRAALHQHLIKSGRVPAALGKFYDQAFDDRQEADYAAVADFEEAGVRARIAEAREFVTVLKALLRDK